MQEYVADAMAADFDIAHPERSPAFFFHLGDVNYFDNTDKGYQEQFYVPYKRYPGKIIAIPGNHDGEIYKYDGSSVGQKTTCAAFIRNFVQATASIPPGRLGTSTPCGTSTCLTTSAKISFTPDSGQGGTTTSPVSPASSSAARSRTSTSGMPSDPSTSHCPKSLVKGKAKTMKGN